MKFAAVFVSFLFISVGLYAQVIDTTSSAFLKQLALSGYLEFYAAVDDDDNIKHQRPDFLYNNTRTGELAMNLGFVKASWNTEKQRGNIAMMAGTYAERNLATESKIFQQVFEANVGLRLSQKRSIWLDIGILNSHIGLESAIGRDNPTLTRSMCAENSPYYETGGKLSANSKNKRWLFSFLVLNGWQRIYKLDGDFLPAIGMQINYKVGDKLQLNYSNYLGDQSPDEDYGARFFNNLFFVYSPIKKLSFQGAFDFGMQPDFADEQWPMNYWFGWFGIAKINITEKTAVAMRFEQYNDPNEVIISNQYAEGFVTNGYSVNLDYSISKSALIRIEGRRFQGKDDTFENREGELRKVYDGVTASLSVSF